MHVHSMTFEDHNVFAPKIHVSLQDRIFHVIPIYSWYIPCEIHVWAFFVAHPRLEASDRDFLRIFSVLDTDRQPTPGWGRPKFPQPGVHLVNMAAPPQVRASPIGTAALKSVPLSAVVLVWNC
jgi:hypothetical protein